MRKPVFKAFVLYFNADCDMVAIDNAPLIGWQNNVSLFHEGVSHGKNDCIE